MIKRKFNKLDKIVSSIMATKKGQVTIFIIIGLMILLTFSILFYFQKSIEGNNINLKRIFSFKLDTIPIKNYVEDCLQATSNEAINYVGKHGGYYDLDNVISTNSAIYNTAYYFFLGQNLMPNKNNVEKEISNYIDDNLFFCLQNFAVFEEQGFNIKFGDIKSSVNLNNDNLRVSLNLPLTIKKDSQIYKLDYFIVNADTKFGRMLDSASALIENQMYTPDNICISCIFKEAEKNDIVIELYNLNNDTVIFLFFDVKNDQKLIYANKYVEYSCDNLPPDVDSSFLEVCLNKRLKEVGYTFYVEDIPNMNASIDKLFYYKINASGRDLNFYDYTPLFDIMNETGDIFFLPKKEQIGNYTIWIRVKDSMLNEVFKTFQLNIINKTKNG
jgi:hypothetical protein